jgi:hypothetical protein
MNLEPILKSDTNFGMKNPSGVLFLFCDNRAEFDTCTKFCCNNNNNIRNYSNGVDDNNDECTII